MVSSSIGNNLIIQDKLSQPGEGAAQTLGKGIQVNMCGGEQVPSSNIQFRFSLGRLYIHGLSVRQNTCLVSNSKLCLQ